MTKNLKKLLIDLGLDVTQLAKGIGWSRTWTSLVCNGSRGGSGTRKALLDYLKVQAATQGVNVPGNLWPADKNPLPRQRSLSNRT